MTSLRAAVAVAPAVVRPSVCFGLTACSLPASVAVALAVGGRARAFLLGYAALGATSLTVRDVHPASAAFDRWAVQIVGPLADDRGFETSPAEVLAARRRAEIRLAGQAILTLTVAIIGGLAARPLGGPRSDPGGDFDPPDGSLLAEGHPRGPA